MQKLLTAADINNTVRMTRSLHSGAILISEGDTDARLLKRLCHESSCLVVPAHGRDNAIGALAMLDAGKVDGVLSIIDSDFCQLDGVKPSSPNLFHTDCHDLETMILQSNTLQHLLGEFGSTARLANLGKSVPDLLLHCALPIGFLRWISSPTKDNLRLKFEGLDFAKFVDPNTLSTDIDALLAQVRVNSRHVNFNDTTVKAKIAKLQNQGHDAWHVCSGHDMVQILCIGLNCVFGNSMAKDLTFETLERSLRLAYDHTQFESTSLYQSIAVWEQAHPSFKVLA